MENTELMIVAMAATLALGACSEETAEPPIDDRELSRSDTFEAEPLPQDLPQDPPVDPAVETAPDSNFRPLPGDRPAPVPSAATPGGDTVPPEIMDGEQPENPR